MKLAFEQVDLTISAEPDDLEDKSFEAPPESAPAPVEKKATDSAPSSAAGTCTLTKLFLNVEINWDLRSSGG